MNDTYQHLMLIKDSIRTAEQEQALETEFQSMESQSIDYGIMEKAENIYILPGTFGWDDGGSWLAVERIKRSNEYGNIVNGNVITVNTNNCIIQAEQKLIATVGLEDLVVVKTIPLR